MTRSRLRLSLCLGDKVRNLYVADSSNALLRKLTLIGEDWAVTTLAGNACNAGRDGTGPSALLATPAAVAVDKAGNVYVSDLYGSTIRKGFPAGSVPAPMMQAPSLSAGHFIFGISGLPSVWVNIESSTDLAAWQVVGTCPLEGGINCFVNPDAAAGAQFYRVGVR
jgi:hypothetical protein